MVRFQKALKNELCILLIETLLLLGRDENQSISGRLTRVVYAGEIEDTDGAGASSELTTEMSTDLTSSTFSDDDHLASQVKHKKKKSKHKKKKKKHKTEKERSVKRKTSNSR